MAESFYFYDLETSGFNPREARIMQFAGQRVDMNLQPLGEPHNILIKLSEDVVPEPDAILVTGITPQSTLSDGITEVEFLKLFHEEIATPGTIFIGFNTVRFDDEFMRYLHYRNFYDPYEWQYLDDPADDAGRHPIHLRTGLCLCQPGHYSQGSECVRVPDPRTGDDLLRHYIPHQLITRLDAIHCKMASTDVLDPWYARRSIFRRGHP